MVVTNPLRRSRIKAYFMFGLTDKEMIDALHNDGIELSARDIHETRMDMGLQRTKGVKPMGRTNKKDPDPEPDGPRKRPNALHRALRIIDTYAKQTGGKNMAPIAKEFDCTREYVRQVVTVATNAGWLDEHGYATHWDVRKQIGLS